MLNFWDKFFIVGAYGFVVIFFLFTIIFMSYDLYNESTNDSYVSRLDNYEGDYNASIYTYTFVPSVK